MSAASTLAWHFARSVSARPNVRVAAADAAGNFQNSYPTLVPLDGPEPLGPFAVQLGSRTGLGFALLGFDLDAGRGDVHRDLAVLHGLLDGAGISYLSAQSGPSGGRHVWVRLADTAPAGLVRQLAHGLQHQMPTLDIAPLLNPAAGALRPPGALHRDGGRSELVDGDLAVFLASATTAEQVQALTETVVDALAPVSRDATVRIVAADDAGHPHLPGPKRPLPAGSQRALQQPVDATVDASQVLWSVLLGAARSHWTLGDVEDLVRARAPGLEHLRTARQPGSARRTRRTDAESSARLRYQWARAVAYVEATGPTAPHSAVDDFVERAGEIAAHVDTVQDRADAAPGRWSRPGGATDRLVLDQLCVLHLQAVADVVEADHRRLAMACGLGRETVRRALQRLSGDSWIHQTAPTAGPRAATWTALLSTDQPPVPSGPEPLSTGPELHRAQADSRPPVGGWALLVNLLDRLQIRIGLQAHDVFTRQGLGHDAGAIWAHLVLGTDPAEISHRTGYSVAQADQHLDALHRLRLWHWDSRSGQATTDPEARTEAAQVLEVHGTLAERSHRYRFERDVWAWWLEHLAWLRTRGKAKRRVLSQAWRQRQSPAQLAIAMPGLTRTMRYGPYPRDGGRADHCAARAVIALTAAGLTDGVTVIDQAA